jgi:hypothetical protein
VRRGWFASSLPSHFRSAQLGTTLLIDAGDYDIACCFTSEHYGARRDGEDKILDSTRRAFEDLVGQLKQGGSHPPPVAACKLNAGRFGVRRYGLARLLPSRDLTPRAGQVGADKGDHDRGLRCCRH